MLYARAAGSATEHSPSSVSSDLKLEQFAEIERQTADISILQLRESRVPERIVPVEQHQNRENALNPVRELPRALRV
jgi:hypothetical protein